MDRPNRHRFPERAFERDFVPPVTSPSPEFWSLMNDNGH